jgi:hypothetical protein
MVLLVLESDAASTSLIGHCANKKCWFQYDATNQKVMAALAIFQACVCVCLRVGIGKCLISILIGHMVRLFEFCIRRNFKDVICVSSLFFAFTGYFAIIHSVNSATFI